MPSLQNFVCACVVIVRLIDAMFVTCHHYSIPRFCLGSNMHLLLPHLILLTQIKTESETVQHLSEVLSLSE